MSAFIVTNETICIILGAVKGNQRKDLSPVEFMGGLHFPLYDMWNGYTFEDYGRDLHKLGQMLVNLNYEAVNYRYKEDDLPTAFVFVTPKQCPTLLQMYEAIDLFLYQCAEGKIPERSSLYKEVEALQAKVSAAIIENAKVVLKDCGI